MRPNPLHDALSSLSGLNVFNFIFCIFLLGGCAAAVHVWRRDPGQRTTRHVGILLLRLLTGTMWWQQSLWKVPPSYAGLTHWFKEIADHGAVPLQSWLVGTFVLPHIGLFGPLIYCTEVLIGFSFLLGLLTRLTASLGVIMALNLWLGLYNTSTEWPWTYGYLIIIQFLFILDPPGRILGLDTLLRQHYRQPAMLLAS